MKNPLESILVCTPYSQFNDSGVEHAAAIARQWGATLTLVDVVKGDPAQPSAGAKGRVLLQLEARAEALKTKGIKAKAKVLRGQPEIEILNEVERYHHDLVIWSLAPGEQPRALHRVPRDHLLKTCPCPIWFARHRGAAIERVMIARGKEPWSEKLTEELFEMVGAVDSLKRAELYLCGSFEGGTLPVRSERVHPAETLEAITELTKKLSIDLLVLNTWAPKTGLAPGTAGTVESIVRGGRCSVLAVTSSS